MPSLQVMRKHVVSLKLGQVIRPITLVPYSSLWGREPRIREGCPDRYSNRACSSTLFIDDERSQQADDVNGCGCCGRGLGRRFRRHSLGTTDCEAGEFLKKGEFAAHVCRYKLWMTVYIFKRVAQET